MTIACAGKTRRGFLREGPGLIDCNLYAQPGPHLPRLVSLTNAAPDGSAVAICRPGRGR
jgi:hypothetical protein